MARRHRFRGFGMGMGHPYIAGPLIGGGATQIGFMLAHLHARKNPTALRHAGIHGAIFGGIVSGVLAMTTKHRETGISALVTCAVMALPRVLEGFMGLGHRDESAAMHGLGVITASEYNEFSGAGDEPVVQLLDSGGGGSGFGTHVAEELHPMSAPMTGDSPVELLGSGFGANFAS